MKGLLMEEESFSVKCTYIHCFPKYQNFYLYCCTVHSEDSLIIKHQQMHSYILFIVKFTLSVLMWILEQTQYIIVHLSVFNN
jgi:hypothetical protein